MWIRRCFASVCIITLSSYYRLQTRAAFMAAGTKMTAEVCGLREGTRLACAVHKPCFTWQFVCTQVCVGQLLHDISGSGRGRFVVTARCLRLDAERTCEQNLPSLGSTRYFLSPAQLLQRWGPVFDVAVIGTRLGLGPGALLACLHSLPAFRRLGELRSASGCHWCKFTKMKVTMTA